jgi:2-C-methyl-D-erythritol 4-phosphate cytidylyltransferase
MKSKVTAVILAAGQGKRMNSAVAKQFLSLQEKPVIYYSLKTFEESSVDDIILVTGKDQINFCKDEIIDRYHFKKVSKIIEGGKERYDSVYQALLNIEGTDYVLIHDGARPFITTEIIETIIENTVEYKACIAATPVKETIKVADSQGFITSTPSRSTLWTAQTPQAFEYRAIRKAYDLLYKDTEGNRAGVTDDAMVYETYLKSRVKILSGDYNNIKITTPEDLILAEQITEKILCENDKKKQQFPCE